MPGCVGSSGERSEELGPYTFVHPMGGQEVTTDSLLLVEFALPICDGSTVCDLGTGSGIIPLLLAWKSGAGAITGVEVVSSSVEAARRNVTRNRLSERIAIVEKDWLDLPHIYGEGSFDLVVSNPPYMKRGEGRVSPDEVRDRARREGEGGLGGMLRVAAYLMGETGRLCLVYPVRRLHELMEVLGEAGLRATRLRFVYTSPPTKPAPKSKNEAKLFLLEASRRGTLKVEEDLYLPVSA